MRVQHLNCGSLRPPTAGVPGGFVCHCLLLGRGDSLALVDTGIGLGDIAEPVRRLEEWFVRGMAPALDPAETAIRQVETLGYRPEQVTDIVLTHVHRDHIGGLSDFPGARVHATPAARAAAELEHRPHWGQAPQRRATWHGFAAWSLPDLPGDDVVLVELPGHSTGHAGVAVRTDGEGWLLHAGDAYFHRSELDSPDRTPEAVMAFAALMQEDADARQLTVRRLAALAHDGVVVVSAHDAAEIAQLS